MRARVFLWPWQLRDTPSLLSPCHDTGEYQPRGEHDCWGGALLGETNLVSPAQLPISRPRDIPSNHDIYNFLSVFSCARHEGENQSPKATVTTYRKHSRTTFNRPCTEQQSTYRSKFVLTRVWQRKHAVMEEQASQVLPRSMYEYLNLVCFFFLLWCFFVNT